MPLSYLGDEHPSCSDFCGNFALSDRAGGLSIHLSGGVGVNLDDYRPDSQITSFNVATPKSSKQSSGESMVGKVFGREVFKLARCMADARY